MQNYIWNIEIEDIRYGEKLNYMVKGWFVSRIPASFEVRASLSLDTNEVPVKVKWVARPDIKALYPDSQGVQGPGFIIVLEDIDISNSENVLKIQFRIQDDIITIAEKSISEIRKLYQKNIISKCLDKIADDGSNLILEGWALSKEGELTYELVDSEQKKIEAPIKRISRPDVNVIFQQEEHLKLGFKILVDQKYLYEKKIYISLSDGKNTDQIEVNLKRYRMSKSRFSRYVNLFRPSTVRKALSHIKSNGWEGVKYLVKKLLHMEKSNYEKWLKQHLPGKEELEQQKQTTFYINPKFSIVIPLYNTPLEYLKEVIDSVQSQTYGNFELCLADGSDNDKIQAFIKKNYRLESKILYKKLTDNKGISENTNEAIKMATGDYIMLSDHDDLIAPNALFEMVQAINKNPDIDIIYTDEDKVSMDSKHYFDPNFKSDFNIDYLRSTNYICHIFVVRKEVIDQVGMLQPEYDGAQDYDFILRCCETTKHIHHIPKVLYHWRAHQNSTAGNPESKKYAIDASRKALEAHFKRIGIEAELRYADIFIMFQSIPRIIGNPKVSIVISSKDHVEDLSKCIESIEQKSTWKNYEIIVVENNSEEQRTFAYYEDVQARYENVKVVYWDKEFNYSAVNNYGAKYAEGEYLILLNNDTEVITPQWMEYMLGYCQREDVGIVGAKLCYSDDTVQHCGVAIGMGGFAGHILTRYDKDAPGVFGRLKAIHDVSAVTAACLMVKKSVFDQVNGLDESFKVALNDIDFCLRVRECDKLVVINPWAELYHYESKSRGMEDDPEKLARFKDEINRFRTRWADILKKGDPYYNPNLTLKYTDCSIRMRKEKFDLVDETEM